MRTPRPARGRSAGSRGAVAVLIAMLLMAVLVPLCFGVLTLGYLYLVRAQMRNAADSAAATAAIYAQVTPRSSSFQPLPGALTSALQAGLHVDGGPTLAPLASYPPMLIGPTDFGASATYSPQVPGGRAGAIVQNVPPLLRAIGIPTTLLVTSGQATVSQMIWSGTLPRPGIEPIIQPLIFIADWSFSQNLPVSSTDPNTGAFYQTRAIQALLQDQSLLHRFDIGFIAFANDIILNRGDLKPIAPIGYMANSVARNGYAAATTALQYQRSLVNQAIRAPLDSTAKNTVLNDAITYAVNLILQNDLSLPNPQNPALYRGRAYIIILTDGEFDLGTTATMSPGQYQGVCAGNAAIPEAVIKQIPASARIEVQTVYVMHESIMSGQTGTGVGGFTAPLPYPASEQIVARLYTTPPPGGIPMYTKAAGLQTLLTNHLIPPTHCKTTKLVPPTGASDFVSAPSSAAEPIYGFYSPATTNVEGYATRSLDMNQGIFDVNLAPNLNSFGVAANWSTRPQDFQMYYWDEWPDNVIELNSAICLDYLSQDPPVMQGTFNARWGLPMGIPTVGPGAN